jgi:tetratricopeptide (TPR) repeat protein
MVRTVLALAMATALLGASPEFERAQKLYNYTDFNGSLKLLLKVEPKDAATLELIGRSYYMLGDYRRASDWLEKAAGADPASSRYAHWLGRAYGRRAETSTPFTAPRWASRARQAFEKAVELDPNNNEAVNDLFEYYLQAPGFLGGGYDKAASLAERIARRDAVEGHYAHARLAEKRKDARSAEQQFRRAAELAPGQVGRLIDLARFLAKQGRFQESEQSFQRAARVAPNNPKLLYERASTYIETGRNLEEARQLLKQYLNATLTPDDPPRFMAERLLRQVDGG